MRELHTLLHEQLPQLERVLVGHEAILLYLRHLGVTQWSKRLLT